MTTADATFQTKFNNQYLCFGPQGMVHKLGGKWEVRWDGRGFDTLFDTKEEAMLKVRDWAQMVRAWE